MSKLPFLLTRFDSDVPHRSDISSRLREHLMRLRGHEIDDTVEIWDDTTGAVSEHDLTRIHRRATAYVDRLRAASGTAHLKPDEKARLASIKDGVRATTITTEARADGIAAGLHAQMPWMAPAKNVTALPDPLPSGVFVQQMSWRPGGGGILQVASVVSG